MGIGTGVRPAGSDPSITPLGFAGSDPGRQGIGLGLRRQKPIHRRRLIHLPRPQHAVREMRMVGRVREMLGFQAQRTAITMRAPLAGHAAVKEITRLKLHPRLLRQHLHHPPRHESHDARKRFEIQAGITNALSFGLVPSPSCGVERGHLLDDGGLDKVSTDSTDDDSLMLPASIRIPPWA